MKILHVITSLRVGGAEKLLVDIAPLLRDAGNTVEILLFDGTNTFLKQKIEGTGIKVHAFSKSGYIYNPFYIFKLCFFLSNYDIIHTHNTACQYFVAIASLFIRRKIKLVTTEHSTFNRRRSKNIYRFFDRIIYHCYDAIICISSQVTKNLIEHLGTNKAISTIYNGINLDLYKDVCPVNRDEDKIIVVMVAGFRVEKDQDTLIKAMTLLDNKYILWLVGEGVRIDQCKHLVTDLKLSDRVLFLGMRNDVPNVLTASDIVVMSSHWEGFGLAAVEGMAAGKPVVVSDVKGLAEVVGDAGLKFEVGDYKKLASYITLLSTDIDFYRNISERAKLQVKKFAINQMIEEYVKLYNML